MPKPFSVNVSRREPGGVSVFELEGFVDAHTAPDVERAIQSEIDAGQVRLVVDGRKMTYISSAGLGVFMGLIDDLRGRGGDLKICGLAPKVHQIFELVGFHRVYDILEDCDAALRRYKDAPDGEV